MTVKAKHTAPKKRDSIAETINLPAKSFWNEIGNVSIFFNVSSVYCVRDASQGYFGKDPIDMTDYESTLLAGIPNAPSVYSLTANPDLAEQRQQYVIQQMVKYGYISEGEGKKLSQ